MPAIERFAGIPVQGWAGPLPGGGYRGATGELDTVVAEAAARLADEYDRDIVIRFNSDRRSGGAWLKDGPTLDALVGVCAGLRHHTVDDAWWAERFNQTPESTIYHATNVKAEALADPSLATEAASIGQPYSYVLHRTQDDAFRWLRENVRLPR